MKIFLFSIIIWLSPYGSFRAEVSERLDDISMIEGEEWINPIRTTINKSFGNIYDYGLIVVCVNYGESKIKWAMGLRQKSEDDNGDPFQEKKGVYKYTIRSMSAPEEKIATTEINTELFVKSVTWFHALVESAATNKMIEKSSSSVRYYIFSRILDENNKLATGLFNSCVLVEPDRDHEGYVRIKDLLKLAGVNK